MPTAFDAADMLLEDPPEREDEEGEEMEQDHEPIHPQRTFPSVGKIAALGVLLWQVAKALSL